MERSLAASRLEYAFSGGRIEAGYKQGRISFKRGLLSILVQEDERIVSIQLVAEFPPDSARLLAADFTLMAAHEEGFYTYAFEMKPAALERYQSEFSQAITLEDWLKVGPFACLNMENYECLGYGRLE